MNDEKVQRETVLVAQVFQPAAARISNPQACLLPRACQLGRRRHGRFGNPRYDLDPALIQPNPAYSGLLRPMTKKIIQKMEKCGGSAAHGVECVPGLTKRRPWMRLSLAWFDPVTPSHP
jgi:hypothetical protein